MELTGKEIKEIRLSLGLTLEAFGEKIDGANKSIVSKWERDETKPSPRRLKIINEMYRDSEVNKLQNENQKLREALERACNSLGADIDDYLQE
ncbi:TPA: helix-turn-helix domain-containing protein [Bacillus cytotoxicus]|uniref:helix-turn-helix domain-containing protein n=1 Tax=Bacillus cereus group TaxID=86661 RepID=UPI001F5AE6C7|nr:MULTISPECIES: helix-turn-helix domain-containing protein [Bacillus cereus group]MDH2882470.1 helix-turn-helix domain-containing protein [Bacillus cytotoxicus]HDR4573332.1 helix-turn-helix domain-containing protein [Bacillus cytotoxicus]HDR4589364.1 helix-turn-helix domain-containing protein [Bacillus cytotoxicus]